MRDRLIKMIDQKQVYGVDQEQPRKNELLLLDNDELADYLLAEGVIVPPVKVGQMVYVVYGDKVIQGKVRLIRPFIDKEKTIFKGNIICEADEFLDDTKEEVELLVVFVTHYGIERVAFLTREEAEKALAERSKE